MNKEPGWNEPKDQLRRTGTGPSGSCQGDPIAIFESFSKFLPLLLDTLPDFFWAKDMEDRYLFVNKAMCGRLLKCDNINGALGKTDLYFAAKEKEKGYHHTFGDIGVNSDHVVKQSGKPERFFEEGLVRGTYLLLDVFKAPLFDETGKMIATVGYARDVTEAKKNEAACEQAQKCISENEKNALIGQVAGKMAHDFNNILGAVMGLSELAMMDCRQEDTRQYLKDILSQIERGKALTQNLTTFAKNKEPFYSLFNLREKLDRVMCIMQKDLQGVSVSLKISEEIFELAADPDMFETAVVSLMLNAIHAVSKSGNPEIEVKVFLEGKNLIIEVKDNGCGIPYEFKERIYDPAFSLKGGKDMTCSYQPWIKGTGYGLSNVKRIMDKHKGTVSFDSHSFKGTKFLLSFPVLQDKLAAGEKKDDEKMEVVKEKQILVVEDEQVISNVQYGILSAKPYEHRVDIAYNGQMAMDFFSRGNYDLISLDYMLPGKYNGMDVYHHIRKQSKTIPVLLISGNIEFIESIQYLKLSDKRLSYLPKPCRTLEYIEAINRLLTRAGSWPCENR